VSHEDERKRWRWKEKLIHDGRETWYSGDDFRVVNARVEGEGWRWWRLRVGIRMKVLGFGKWLKSSEGVTDGVWRLCTMKRWKSKHGEGEDECKQWACESLFFMVFYVGARCRWWWARTKSSLWMYKWSLWMDFLFLSFFCCSCRNDENNIQVTHLIHKTHLHNEQSNR